MRATSVLMLAAGLALAAGCGGKSEAPSAAAGKPAAVVLRVGHFPNLTHVHGLVAHQLSRQGKGWFEQRLGGGVTLQWFVYNAGPTAMEAMLAGSLDLTYVGPNPALNAHSRSGGKEVRVIAGATLGGAALVVAGDGRIKTAADFRGRRVATPQLGNTQDIACRSWLKSNGFNVTQLGGDVLVVPTSNPDQLALFAKGDIDAVWTVEPWVSRLEREAGGKVFLEEPEAVTTLLVSSAAFLRDHRALAHSWVEAHAELTKWIEANPEAAQELLRAELKEETKIAAGEDLVKHAWGRMKLTTAVPQTGLEQLVAAAADTGFLPGKVVLDELIEVP